MHLIVYLDDLIIFGKSYDEHLQRLEEVLRRLEKANMKLSPKKCHFLKTKVAYLGHVVSHGSIQPHPDKVKAISEYPRPTNEKQLRQFLGLASYYRRFIRNFSSIASPLYRLLEKKVPYTWCSACESAFSTLKRLLANDVTLAFPDFSKPFRVTTDASNIAMGGVLSQIQEDGSERPIAFVSKTLNKTQRKYSTIEREALSIVHCLEQFSSYLYGQRFTLITDHRPLTWLKTMTNPTPKLGRWQMILEQFDFDIIYKQGKLNTNADALSRVNINNVQVELACELSEETIREEQLNDATLQDVRRIMDGENIRVNKNSNLWPFVSKLDQFYIGDNDIMYRQTNEDVTQIVLPPSLHEHVFQLLHEQPCAGHLASDKVEGRFTSQFYFPNIKPKIMEFVRKCQECALHKFSRENKIAPLQPIKSTRPLQIVQIDFTGELTTTHDGKKYILTVIDHFTKYARAYATSNRESKTVVRCLEQFICDVGGIPETIQSDNGKEFASHYFNTFCDVFGIKPVKSTTYHPQSQGLVEKFNGTLKTMLASYTNENQTDWSDYIHLCVFAYNTAVQKSIKISPHEALRGQPARTTFSSLFKHQDDVKTPAEYAVKMKKRLSEIHEIVKSNQDLADEASKEYYDRKSTDVEFPVGARVWLDNTAHKVGLNDKMKPKVTGPWIVKKRKNVNYDIENEQGTEKKRQTVHRNRIRTCYSPQIRDDSLIEEEEQPAVIVNEPKPTEQPVTSENDTEDEDEVTWLWQPTTVQIVWDCIE
jgi:transposase InsO family protein